nr:hypothetical protein [Candidatus Njordarchaeota archaeon]
MEKEKEKRKVKGEDQAADTEKEGIDVESELRRLEEEVKMESRERMMEASTQQEQTMSVNKTQLLGKTTFECPDWANLPWMKRKPSRAEDVDSWLRDWCDLVLKWCQLDVNVHHVVGLKDFKVSKPFDALPEMELREILQHLVDRGLAKWIGKDKTVARIMWRSLEEWANDVYQWAYNNGVEMLDRFAIQGANKDFSSLPKPDIEGVLEVMVKKKMLKWIDKKHEQAKLIYQ